MTYISRVFLTGTIVFLWAVSAWAEDSQEVFFKGYTAYIEKDFGLAKDTWWAIAEKGHPRAQYLLGVMYFNGQGVDIDYQEASRWFQLCAGRGDVGAQYFLAMLLEEGKGIKRDIHQAGEWYQRAAEQGYPDAQLKLAEMYTLGEGKPKNLAKAYGWFQMAGVNGIQSGITKSLSLEQQFSSQELEEAKAMAEYFWKRYELPTRQGSYTGFE